MLGDIGLSVTLRARFIGQARGWLADFVRKPFFLWELLRIITDCGCRLSRNTVEICHCKSIIYNNFSWLY